MLIDLSQRSTETELMDLPDLHPQILQAALDDVSRVNRLLGGFKITLDALFNNIKTYDHGNDLITIADLGCGDGEMLRKIALQNRKKNLNLRLIGFDINEKCINQAKENSSEYPEIEFYVQDIFALDKKDYNLNYILCTLTLHHFEENQLSAVLKKCHTLSNQAVIVNDLHRSILPYYLFKGFSFFFIKSDVAKNDGLVSIKRGFKRKEFQELAQKANVKRYVLKWKWAFRYLLIIYAKN